MKRKFNYTGRKKIPLENIKIILQRKNDLVESFSAEINVKDLELPEDAIVFIETYFRTELLAFNFGTVKKIEAPDKTDLSHMGFSEHMRFRVIITDSKGLILAMADKVKPVNEKNSNCILPIKSTDLGNQIWELDFSDEMDGPVLMLNKKINGIQNFAISNNQFVISVFPAILREIFMKIVFIDNIDDPEEPQTEWHKKWIDFSKNTLKIESQLELNRDDNDFESEKVTDWIDNVVEKFTDSITSKNWRSFIKEMTGEDST
jgi:hypothetical protein